MPKKILFALFGLLLASSASAQTITRLDPWKLITSPFNAITSAISGKDLYLTGNATSTKSLSAPVFCLNGECRSAWPTGGSISQLGQVGDVSTSTLAWGHLLYWSGSNWQDIATSSLGISGAGTVTSVDMTVPTGLSISGNPVTTSGTLALSLASGYVIPKSASTTEWDTAYSWGNHASAGYLTNLLGGLNAILTNSTTTALTISGLATPAGAYLAVNPLGQVIATTTPSGGGGTWGSITGTLSAQTDLQNALNDKASLSLPNTFSAHNIFSSLFATNASTTNSTSTISYVSSKLSVASTTPSDHALSVQGKALISATTTMLALDTQIHTHGTIAQLLPTQAKWSTTTSSGIDERPYGLSTVYFDDYLIFNGYGTSSASWAIEMPSTYPTGTPIYIDLWLKSTSTSQTYNLYSYFWKYAEGDNIDTTSGYDVANMASSTGAGTASTLWKTTITATNLDGLAPNSIGRFKLKLDGTAAGSVSNLNILRGVLRW